MERGDAFPADGEFLDPDELVGALRHDRRGTTGARPVTRRGPRVAGSCAHTLNAVVDVHADDPEFGYRFIADELERGGQPANERRVWRLCRENRVWSTTTSKGRRSSGKRPGPAVHEDLVQRNFSAADLDAVWLTDITEHPTAEGKLYMCAIKDLCSNRIVGYAIDERMTAQLVVSALRSAIARRRPTGTVIVHSDRGGQFRARSFRSVLNAAGLR